MAIYICTSNEVKIIKANTPNVYLLHILMKMWKRDRLSCQMTFCLNMWRIAMESTNSSLEIGSAIRGTYIACRKPATKRNTQPFVC